MSRGYVRIIALFASVALLSACAAFDYDDRYRMVNDLARMEVREGMTAQEWEEHNRYWTAQQAYYLDLLMSRHPRCRPIARMARQAAGAGVAYSTAGVGGLWFVGPRFLADGLVCEYGSHRRIDCERYRSANAFTLLDRRTACSHYQ